jgi:NAD(P)-dependent dehydrogenase (short-subunit alcohol dehydrogenase family)
MRDLHGSVALVTGGGSGIGKLTAVKLAERGADVVIADVAVEAGRAAAAAVDGRFVELDVADPAGWEPALQEAVGDADLSVAHLNAGIATGQTDIVNLTDDEYRRVMGVNVDGVVFGTRAVAKRMRDGGAIVATASLGGLVPMPTDPIYSLGKHAVVAFVRSIAPLLHPRGITVNAICPGFVDTPLVTDDFRGLIAQMNVPLLDADAVAGTVLQILDEGRTGEAWFIQPGRDPAPYEFRGVPGPRPDA